MGDDINDLVRRASRANRIGFDEHGRPVRLPDRRGDPAGVRPSPGPVDGGAGRDHPDPVAPAINRWLRELLGRG